MKKILSLIFAMSILILTATGNGHAIGITWGYELRNDGTAIITKYDPPVGVSTNVIIPEQLDGHKVSAIEWLGPNTSHSMSQHSIERLTIPDSVTEIKGDPFEKVYFLKEIIVSPNHPTFVSSDGVLYRKENSEIIHIPDEIEVLTIPDFVKEIPNNTLCSLENLKEVNVSPSHPTFASIDGVLFRKDTKELICFPREKEIKDIYTVPDGIKSIGESAFYYCSVENIVLPESVTSIKDSAFNKCRKLKSIALPPQLQTIGNSVFYGCESIEKVMLPPNVQLIGDSAFNGCEKLKEILLPEGLRIIGEDAFRDCKNLKSVAIPASVEEINGNPFNGCRSLEVIDIGDNNNYYMVGGVLCGAEPSRIIYCLPDSTDIGPALEDVEYIEKNAFSNNLGLTNIIIPNNITGIGYRAFYHCENLVSVTIPDTVDKIAAEAFCDCFNLKEIIIPNSVREIAYGAFYGCKNLTTVTIPSSVVDFGDREFIFGKCDNISEIIVEQGSIAEEYCVANDLPYIYPNSLDWLTD